jgi:hypothetical protein
VRGFEVKGLPAGYSGVRYSRTRQQQERRLRRRLDMHISGIVRTAQGQSRSCRVLNLSDDGLYFRYAAEGSAQEYHRGEPVEIFMAHHPLNDEAGLCFRSKIVRTDSHGVGVRFLRSEPEAAYKLSGYLPAERKRQVPEPKGKSVSDNFFTGKVVDARLVVSLLALLLMGLGTWLGFDRLGKHPTQPQVVTLDQPVQDSDRFAQIIEPQPEVDAGAEQKQWVINIITFRSEQEADAFLQNAHSRGVNAYKEATLVDGKSLWRIRVGGMKTHTQARLKAIRVRALLGMDDLWITTG